MNDKLEQVIKIANKYGHTVVRVKLDEDEMIYECMGGTPHSVKVSDYIKED